MTTRVSLLIVVGLLVGTVLGAQTAKPKVYGVGVQPCAAWLSGTNADGIDGIKAQMERLSVIAWATGYTTGAAAVYATHGVILRDTTGTGIVESIQRHCAAKPGGTVEEAAASLVAALLPK